MSISLDIMKVKSIDIGAIRERDVTQRSSYSTRAITITTESGEEFVLNLYTNSNIPDEPSELLKISI